ncbi:MAG: Hpt domain-containing protein [Hyphomicrobiales bacterium]
MTNIDIEALRRLKEVIGGDSEDLQELMDDFCDIAPDLVAQIVSACSAHDLGALKIASHTLKSNSRDLGAIELGELSARIEAASQSGDETDLDLLCAPAQDLLNSAIVALKEIKPDDV